MLLAVHPSFLVEFPIGKTMKNAYKRHAILGVSMEPPAEIPSSPVVVDYCHHQQIEVKKYRNVPPARNIPSLCWCLPSVPPASAKQGDRDCYFLFRQNVRTSGSSSSSRRKQQHEEEAAAAGGSSSSRQAASKKQGRSSRQAATSVCPQTWTFSRRTASRYDF